MRNFAIVTDSASDLPAEYFEEHDIACVDLGFNLDGVIYGGESGNKMDVKVFYDKLRAGAMPTTFQVTPEQARLTIEPLLKEGKDVLVLAFSSGLSGTANSFKIAARDLMEDYPYRHVEVVDSLCASMGEGLFVDYVVKKADEGVALKEARDYAENLKQHICHFFTVDNLFHLKRGGRVSAATAVVGTMLNIKPVLHVDHEGPLIAIGKAMGRKKSISALVDHMKELQTMGEHDPIFISHGDCIEDVNYLISLLKANFPGHEIKYNYVGNVIGTHSGAGTLALFFLGAHR